MSFLDKMKAKEVTNTEVVKKKSLPFLMPKTEEAKEKIDPFGPINELPKEAEEVFKEVEDGKIVEELIEPITETTEINEETISEENSKEEVENTEEETKKETAKDEPKTNEVDSDTTKTIEVENEKTKINDGEVDKEDEPNPKKRTRNTKASKTTKKAELESLPTTEIDFATAIQNIQPPFMDEDWEQFRLDIDQKLGQIEISDDMNPGELKLIISDLSKLRQELWLPLQDTKSLYDSLSAKEPEGLIERVKRVSFTDDHKNDMDRKRSGIMACMSYIPPNSEDPINLYELLHETRGRYNFLKAAMESVQYKTNILITMNGALKLEQSHIPGEV